MKKSISILIIILILMITGCSNKEVIKHNYTYKGENESWTAEYKVIGTETFIKKDNITSYEGNSNKVLTVTYKNDLSELPTIKHLEISYKSSVEEGKKVEDYDNGSTLKKTYNINSVSTNGAMESKDEVINVTINLDGKIETIELKNE